MTRRGCRECRECRVPGTEGGALCAALRAAQNSPALFAEHHRFHGRQGISTATATFHKGFLLIWIVPCHPIASEEFPLCQPTRLFLFSMVLGPKIWICFTFQTPRVHSNCCSLHSCVFQTKAYENGGIARDGAKMVNAVSCVDAARPGFRWEHVGKLLRVFASISRMFRKHT